VQLVATHLNSFTPYPEEAGTEYKISDRATTVPTSLLCRSSKQLMGIIYVYFKRVFFPSSFADSFVNKAEKLLLHYESFLGMDFYGFWPPVKIG
jgi:hypothetical protein